MLTKKAAKTSRQAAELIPLPRVCVWKLTIKSDHVTPIFFLRFEADAEERTRSRRLAHYQDKVSP